VLHGTNLDTEPSEIPGYVNPADSPPWGCGSASWCSCSACWSAIPTERVEMAPPSGSPHEDRSRGGRQPRVSIVAAGRSACETRSKQMNRAGATNAARRKRTGPRAWDGQIGWRLRGDDRTANGHRGAARMKSYVSGGPRAAIDLRLRLPEPRRNSARRSRDSSWHRTVERSGARPRTTACWRGSRRTTGARC